MKSVCVALFCLMLGAAALAQTTTQTTKVYRCGPEGKDLRDSPCPADPRAAASAVNFDAPSSADQAAARAHAQTDAKLAAQMERERQTAEAEARRRNAAASGLSAPVAASAPIVEGVRHVRVVKPHKHHPPKGASAAQ